ncbi:hypothetical protein NHN26_16395 [Rhodovulum tesquicola]|uniref:hypothetical protein n=1 Tax=Rhodovulum tesquicola TaxID=540254 RepID=UPI0020983B05|nr:hypothetical protein [Rhodovulum tesquicola]MCO8146790.1 hypothetical protein [Rhodovulum tesquicola]
MHQTMSRAKSSVGRKGRSGEGAIPKGGAGVPGGGAAVSAIFQRPKSPSRKIGPDRMLPIIRKNRITAAMAPTSSRTQSAPGE